MRRLLFAAMLGMTLFGGLAACQPASDNVYDDDLHGNYPGPATRDELRRY